MVKLNAVQAKIFHMGTKTQDPTVSIVQLRVVFHWPLPFSKEFHVTSPIRDFGQLFFIDSYVILSTVVFQLLRWHNIQGHQTLFSPTGLF